MRDFSDRCHRLMEEAQALKNDAEFCAQLTANRGTLSASHLWLHSADLAITRAADAIHGLIAKVDEASKSEAA